MYCHYFWVCRANQACGGASGLGDYCSPAFRVRIRGGCWEARGVFEGKGGTLF